jgi:hypothetical protein
MLIPHTFDEESHVYEVPGHFVWATGDVISMNGLCDFSMVPSANLEYATNRGQGVHVAILAYETGADVEQAVREFEEERGCGVMDGVMERMKGYFRFRDSYDLKLCGVMEETRVYKHEGTDLLIGGTIDLPCYINGQFTLLDAKTQFKQYGQAAKQCLLKWRLQMQSYEEAMDADEEFWNQVQRPDMIRKAILHLHPNCGKVRGKEATEFEYHPITTDDSLLWDSCIRVAQAKLSSGYKLDRRP